MKTKAGMLGVLIANGLGVPENWGKLTTVRAGEITERLISGAEENISVRIKKTAVPGEVYYNPKWTRVGPGKSRGWYPSRRIAADPVPMTRQVARRKALDAGWPASEFRQPGEFAA